MITIRDLELKKTFVSGDYRRTKFQTTAELMIGERYGSKATITLTDEQTDKVLQFVIGLLRESLTVELQKPEPIEEIVPDPSEPVLDCSDVMESL